MKSHAASISANGNIILNQQQILFLRELEELSYMTLFIEFSCILPDFKIFSLEKVAHGAIVDIISILLNAERAHK